MAETYEPVAEDAPSWGGRVRSLALLVGLIAVLGTLAAVIVGLSVVLLGALLDQALG